MEPIKSIEFYSKRPTFDFNHIAPQWCPTRHLRVFWEAVSLITPEAEKYIMRSVRAYLNDPIVKENPWLEQLIEEFNAQERQHTLIHTALNQSLGIHDIETRSQLRETMQRLSRTQSKIENLALTAALEHLFFSVIKLTFIDTGFYRNQHLDPNVLKVFMWHWCEELEHHSVSINLLSALDNSYRNRINAAYRLLWDFIPICKDIILDIERYYSPRAYRRHFAIDLVKIISYFRKGLEVSAKYFDLNYDVIEAGRWSWPYIEQWRNNIGYAEPVAIINQQPLSMH